MSAEANEVSERNRILEGTEMAETAEATREQAQKTNTSVGEIVQCIGAVVDILPPFAGG